MFYVYELFASDTEIVFYVGKGKGDRWDAHEQEALSGITDNPHKTYTIYKIWDRGAKVGKRKIYESCNEDDCYEVEASTILYYGLSNLTNIRPGGEGSHSGQSFNLKHHPDLVDPFGQVYPKIPNLVEFCYENNLGYNLLRDVVTGARDHYKGWRLYFPNTAPTSWHYENLLV